MNNPQSKGDINMNKCIRRITSIIAVLMLAASLGCTATQTGSQSDDSLEKILSSGQLVLGLDDAFPPMGFRDESGEIVGFDIDMAQSVCDRLGIELITQPIDWDEKETLLNSGEIDCIWNGMSVTDSRKEAMTLSDPYMKNEIIFLVPENSDVRYLNDLAGKTVGVQSGSSAAEKLEEIDVYPEISVVNGNNMELIEMLKSGQADSILIDSVFAYYVAFSEDDQFYVLSDSLAEEKFAIGFRKNDLALRNKIQETIHEIATDGTLSEISTKWFGSDITIAR